MSSEESARDAGLPGARCAGRGKLGNATETWPTAPSPPPAASEYRILAAGTGLAFCPDMPTATPPRATACATELTEAEILERTLRRDEKAWGEFLRRYRPLLVRCIQQILSRCAPHTCAADVEEVYADVLFKLIGDDMRRLRTFDPSRGTKLSSWLTTIATRAAYDALRSSGRRPLTGLDVGALDEPCARTPLDEVIEKERWRSFGDALSRMTSRDRRFVDLYFRDGLEAHAVATNMAIHPKTVYTKKHKIRAQLKKQLSARAQADNPLADLAA